LRRVCTIDREILEAAIPDASQFSPAAAPVPVSVSAPVSVTPAATTPVPDVADPIDEWLMVVDDGTMAVAPASAGADAQAPPVPDLATPKRSAPPAAAAGDPKPGPQAAPVRPRRLVRASPAAHDQNLRPAYRQRTQPRTHLQQVTRRWARRLGIAALCVTAVPVAAAVGVSLWNVSTDIWDHSAPLELPPLPPARPLVQPPALKLPPPPETLPQDAAAAGGTGNDASR
jgi:hypothetical protein